MKKLFAAIYFALSLVLMTGELQTKSITLYFGYYVFVMVNLGVSSLIINKQFKKQQHSKRNIMNLTLKKLILQNFKGIKSLEINLNPLSTDIMGDNGTFKSSIFDGYTWLLFGKDQYGRTDTGKGRFEVKPLDENNQPIHHLDSSVEGV